MAAHLHLRIDFGSQVTKLIARRVRESGVYSEVHPFNKVDATLIQSFNPKAIILSGGPSSVTGTGTPRADESVWESGLPILLGELLLIRRGRVRYLTA